MKLLSTTLQYTQDAEDIDAFPAELKRRIAEVKNTGKAAHA